MAKVVLCHGIHNKANKSALSDFGNVLRDLGHSVREYPYPSRWALSMYSQKVRAKDGKGLYRFCDSDGTEILISHSNGSLVSQNAFKQGLSVDQWFSYSGAATSDGMFYTPENFNYAYSIYNPFDTALKIGSWLPRHPFGRLGSEGYRGNPDDSYDDRWLNVNGASSEWGLDHSHYFDSEIRLWAEFQHANILEPRSMQGIDRRNK